LIIFALYGENEMQYNYFIKTEHKVARCCNGRVSGLRMRGRASNDPGL